MEVIDKYIEGKMRGGIRQEELKDQTNNSNNSVNCSASSQDKILKNPFEFFSVYRHCMLSYDDSRLLKNRYVSLIISEPRNKPSRKISSLESEVQNKLDLIEPQKGICLI